MITLALDACTYIGTVAVFDGERLVAERETEMRGRDAERLMPAAMSALAEGGLALAQLDRVVCGSGPGSFTSLRIAASLAKGIAVGRGIPLFAASSLALIVAGTAARTPSHGRYLAALDALRGEWYARGFIVDGGRVRPMDEGRLLNREDLARESHRLAARLVGPELEDQWRPHARGVALLEDGSLLQGPVDLAAWEPHYGRMAEAQVRWEAAHGRALPR